MPVKCPYTDKISYPTQKQAQKKANKNNKKGNLYTLHEYKCPKCLNWHITKSTFTTHDKTPPSDLEQQIKYFEKKLNKK